MNRKKLIGTIIGVIMFGLLMAGATYAWLSFTANVLNATYNAHSFNYWVNYAGDSDEIIDIPILISSNVNTSTAMHATLTAQRPKGSIADNIRIFLTTTSDNTLTSSGAVKYVICDGTCSSTTFTTAQIKSVTTTSTVEILYDELPGTVDSATNATVTYNVYFWIDAATIDNTHIGQEYSGHLHASSAQDSTYP